MNYNKNFYARRVTKYTPGQLEMANRIHILWKPKSVFDLGCGIGGYLQKFDELKCEISGCDVGYELAKEFMPENIKNKTFEHDATKPLEFNKKYDLVISIEVAEHLEAKYSMQFCENLVKLSSNRIFMTAAMPGQYGCHHVNCQPKQYWIDRMQIFGGIYDEGDTEMIIRTLQPIDKLGICKNIMVYKVIQ